METERAGSGTMRGAENKTFFITGSTDGIGLHTAEKVAMWSLDHDLISLTLACRVGTFGHPAW